MRQPSSKLGTHLPKPVVSSRRDAQFCVSSRRDAIFWAAPEFPRKIRARNILVQLLSFFAQKSSAFNQKSSIWHAVFPGCVFLLKKKENGLFPKHMAWVESACYPGLPACRMRKNHGLQAGTWTFQKHGFVTDSDPHGSKSGSEGIPWQLFSRRISWEEPNPTKTREKARQNRGFPVKKSAKFCENRRNSGKSPKIGRDRLKPG